MAEENGIYVGPRGDVYVGPNINPGEPFVKNDPGNFNNDEGRTKNYLHLAPNGDIRPPGVPGDIAWQQQHP